MGSTPSVLFRQALASLPRGTPLSTQLLRDRGLTAKQVGRLAESGWLRRLGRGVYLLPGDELSREATLAWLGTQVPGLHVAGKTALGWRDDKSFKLPATIDVEEGKHVTMEIRAEGFETVTLDLDGSEQSKLVELKAKIVPGKMPVGPGKVPAKSGNVGHDGIVDPWKH